MQTSLLDLFLMVNFVKRLAMPFKEWPAYSAGVIDESGEILIPTARRTPEQSKSFQTYDVVIRNLKRMLEAFPGGNNPIVSTAAALLLLKEHRGELPEDAPIAVLMDEAIGVVMAQGTDYQMITEDMSVVGGGAIAGTDGTSHNPEHFGGAKVFVVDPATFHKLRYGKKKFKNYKHEIPDEVTAAGIAQYAQEFPKSRIVVKCRSTGHHCVLRPGTVSESDQRYIDQQFVVVERMLAAMDRRLDEATWAQLAPDALNYIGSQIHGIAPKSGETIQTWQDAYGAGKKAAKKAKQNMRLAYRNWKSGRKPVFTAAPRVSKKVPNREAKVKHLAKFALAVAAPKTAATVDRIAAARKQKAVAEKLKKMRQLRAQGHEVSAPGRKRPPGGYRGS